MSAMPREDVGASWLRLPCHFPPASPSFLLPSCLDYKLLGKKVLSLLRFCTVRITMGSAMGHLSAEMIEI